MSQKTTLIDVCSYCKHEIGPDGNKLPVIILTSGDFSKTISHGACNQCRKEQQVEIDRMKAARAQQVRK